MEKLALSGTTYSPKIALVKKRVESIGSIKILSAIKFILNEVGLEHSLTPKNEQDISKIEIYLHEMTKTPNGMLDKHVTIKFKFDSGEIIVIIETEKEVGCGMSQYSDNPDAGKIKERFEVRNPLEFITALKRIYSVETIAELASPQQPKNFFRTLLKKLIPLPRG